MSIWMDYQSKLNEKCMSVLNCTSSFDGTSYKKLQDTVVPVLLFLVVLDQLLHHQV